MEGVVQKLSWPWYAGMGLVAVLWLTYVVLQFSQFSRLSQPHTATVEQIGRDRPQEGYYTVTGGRIAYEWTEGGDAFEGSTMRPTATFVSYVPYTVLATKQMVMLIRLSDQASSQKDLEQLARLPGPSDVQGTFTTLDTVEPELLKKFASDRYPIPAGTPVFLMYDVPTPGRRNRNILFATILAAALIGGPFAYAFFTEPRKPRKKKPQTGWRASSR